MVKSVFRTLLLFLTVLALALPAAVQAAEEEVSLFSSPQQPETAVQAGGGDQQAGAQPASAQPAEADSVPGGDSVAPQMEALPDGSVNIIVSAVGDLTIGGNALKSGKSIFQKELEKQGNDPNFMMRNIRDVLAADHMTLANFEGTLTTAGVPQKKRGNQFLFSAPPEFVSILPGGSIEAVSFENNHAMDHGEEGYNDTTAAFDSAGVVWSSENHVGEYRVGGVSIGMLAYQTFNGRYPDLFDKVPGDIQAAKQKYDIVIVSFHWGDELDYKPNANQVKMGRAAVDAGADLVVGHHSHRINPIEEYKGKLIAYSLANFSFAGNSKPSDMCTFILQVKFNVKDNETKTAGFRIIPARISSKSDYNDFAPTPFTEQRQIESVISVLKSNGRKLEYAVDSYPTDWE